MQIFSSKVTTPNEAKNPHLPSLFPKFFTYMNLQDRYESMNRTVMSRWIKSDSLQGPAMAAKCIGQQKMMKRSWRLRSCRFFVSLWTSGRNIFPQVEVVKAQRFVKYGEHLFQCLAKSCIFLRINGSGSDQWCVWHVFWFLKKTPWRKWEDYVTCLG